MFRGSKLLCRREIVFGVSLELFRQTATTIFSGPEADLCRGFPFASSVISSQPQLLQPALPPIVAGVAHALVHDGVEARVLLDEYLAEGAVLAQQDGLQADQLKQGQEHGDESAL